MVAKQARLSSAGFVAAVHHLATGRTITVAEALNYFSDPNALTDAVRQSGLMDDPQRRCQVQQLLTAQERRRHEERAHGL